MSHSDPMQNPTGGVWGRRATMQPALRDDLLERVLDWSYPALGSPALCVDYVG